MKRLFLVVFVLFLPIGLYAQSNSASFAESTVSDSAEPPRRCATAFLPKFEAPRIDLGLQDAGQEKPPTRWQFKPQTVSCSGVNCGCDIDQQQCNEGCDPNSEGYYSCLSACAAQYRRCAVCCCCDPTAWCPSYC